MLTHLFIGSLIILALAAVIVPLALATHFDIKDRLQRHHVAHLAALTHTAHHEAAQCETCEAASELAARLETAA
jgi:hypothetical protein